MEQKTLDTILLVDDDPITCHLNTKMIEFLGYNGIVAAVSSGETALDYLKKTRSPNRSKSRSILIMLDLNMPNMNGIEFLQKLAEVEAINKEKLHVAILTSNPQNVDNSYRSTLAACLEKPLTEEEMLQLLANLTRG